MSLYIPFFSTQTCRSTVIKIKKASWCHLTFLNEYSTLLHTSPFLKAHIGARYTRTQIRINVDSWNSDYIYAVNRTARFASVLRIAFEDAMITQCDFYYILTGKAIAPVHHLCMMWTYELIDVFKNICSYLHTVGVQIDLDSWNLHLSRSAALSCSEPQCMITFISTLPWQKEVNDNFCEMLFYT